MRVGGFRDHLNSLFGLVGKQHAQESMRWVAQMKYWIDLLILNTIGWYKDGKIMFMSKIAIIRPDQNNFHIAVNLCPLYVIFLFIGFLNVCLLTQRSFLSSLCLYLKTACCTRSIKMINTRSDYCHVWTGHMDSYCNRNLRWFTTTTYTHIYGGYEQ